MADITLFELHVHDGFDFHPSSRIESGKGKGKAKGSGSDVLDDDSTDIEIEGETDGGSGAVGALIGLVVVAALAFGIRRLMSDDLGPMEDLDDLTQDVTAD